MLKRRLPWQLLPLNSLLRNNFLTHSKSKLLKVSEKIFVITRRAHTASDQSKFFERVWENFCPQKFSQVLFLFIFFCIFGFTENSNMPQYTNALIHETSPYLLQHAHNPVNWYPWNETALQKAKAENKPIFLSIGYSSCHWCHVMEHESFENEAIAKILNEHFVSIKVDREERPDLDEIYMTSVQLMTGSGGWPMSVFLTPDMKPFYGGTYFPPEDNYGRPGFKSLLLRLSKAWKEKPEDLIEFSHKLTQGIQANTGGLEKSADTEIKPRALLSWDIFSKAQGILQANFDSHEGGFGAAPKFPPSQSIAFLLRQFTRTEDDSFLRMATFTLDKMADGGLCDQLGGGFHRYSVDKFWLVPHFEKMLYDNALLSEVYLEAYQVTQNPRYAEVASEIFDYMIRDMSDVKGGFHSAEDADSEKEEGKFYVWTESEIFQILDPENAKLFCAFYNVKTKGNFSSHESYHKEKNILHRAKNISEAAKEWNLSEEEFKQKLQTCREKLLNFRSKRIRPFKDDKVLTGWNALMIGSLAKGGAILENPKYLDAAKKAANFILTTLVQNERLFRVYKAADTGKGQAHTEAYLEDYASFISALLDLYESDFDLKWIQAAERFSDQMITLFWDEQDHSFFFTSNEHKNLIARTKPTHDGATPSPTAVATNALLRLAKLKDRPDLFQKAEQVLQVHSRTLAETPYGYYKMLCALEFYLSVPKEIVIVGKKESDDTKQLLRVLRKNFLPNSVVVFQDPEFPQPTIPLLAGCVMIHGKATAYVCKNFACQLPVTTPDDFRKLILEKK